ncbi:carboxypeptidase regulatory-like domain-containing protein [Candidatus Poribacteria bacterium]|nr:carboxypeptidase regulatory-like domain-containing protein [Candidatus Poribacteria bacterium]MYH80036.1 carboxypeptidase regulatory-like domain-containing protein [Candidatus Poribacteria bacterium]MYK93543.1 carboxypeptidase regulatory-like domain-containing protein [Candidatus Poribacteria bacterium]
MLQLFFKPRKRHIIMNNTTSLILLLLFFTTTAVGVCQTPNGASLHGTCVDAENGQPISDVLVRADAEKIASVYPDRDFEHATATDANGAFSLTIPNDPQTYYAFSLMAIHPKYQAKRLRHEMSPGKSKYDLGKIELKRTLTLKGTVSGNKDLAGLIVNLKMHAKSADFFRAAAPIEHGAKTDPTGNFHFAELYPIAYTLTISRNDVIIAYVESINPQKQAEVAIRLPKLETLRGTVVDAQAHPIAGAQIYATRHTETPSGHSAILAAAQTDDAGNFQMQVLTTEPRLLSLEVRKRGYFSRIYENVVIGKMPPMVRLEKGVTLKGHVILPQDLPADAQFTVKVFPADMQMEPSLNPLALYKPLLSRYFPVTESAFHVDGLFAEKYTLYITGDGISATRMDVDASTNIEERFIVADRSTATLQGQVLWADTGDPVHNAVVSRSWYPWELHPSDMSMTLDRFETETDTHGKFKFSNLTEARYQLYIRAVHIVSEDTTKRYQRTRIHKQVAIPTAGTTYRIYLGKQDGTPF